LPEGDIAAGAAADALQQAITWLNSAAEHLSGQAGRAVTAGSLVSDDPIDYLGQLRNNMTFESLSLRHAARFAIASEFHRYVAPQVADHARENRFRFAEIQFRVQLINSIINIESPPI
jgi:hypothetical protein